MTYNIQLAKLISLIHQAECTVKEVNSTDSAVHNQFLKKKKWKLCELSKVRAVITLGLL